MSAIARSAKASWGYPETLLASWEPVLRISADYVEREVVFVALEGARVVAFYALERRGDLWQLEHLWIEPGAQKRGLGRRLFVHALEQARALGPGRVRIEADPHAAAFYARMGAREVGRIAAPLEGDPGRYLPVFEMSLGGP